MLSLSHAVAKGAIPPPYGEHACYCFSPMRYVWDLYADYFGRTPQPIELMISWWASYLRTWDVAATARVDRIAAISRHVERRVARYYRRESTVIYPPVEDRYFEEPAARGRGEYFLVVSSLVPYKRIDVAIEAFRATGEPLWIVGSGPEERRLRATAPPNVRLLGWRASHEFPDLYRRARALVFPGIEDFGIAPVECQAMGRPVVGLRAGGLCETVVRSVTERSRPACSTRPRASRASSAGSRRFACTRTNSTPRRFAATPRRSGATDSSGSCARSRLQD